MSTNLAERLNSFTQLQLDRRHDFSRLTHARIGIGHTGGHMRINDWLDFQSGFAQAKDAVFSHFEEQQITALCAQLQLPAVSVDTQCGDINHYLARPDAGALLNADSENRLREYIKRQPAARGSDLLLVISGGLSPVAIARQMPSFLPAFIACARDKRWSLAPVIINQRGRVALGDHVNTVFQAKITVMLIGERPGLSSPDSMGIYFTYNAKPGCRNDQRNCISNVHEHGLPHQDAAGKLACLLSRAMSAGISGIDLKDDSIQLLAF